MHCTNTSKRIWLPVHQHPNLMRFPHALTGKESWWAEVLCTTPSPPQKRRKITKHIADQSKVYNQCPDFQPEAWFKQTWKDITHCIILLLLVICVWIKLRCFTKKMPFKVIKYLQRNWRFFPCFCKTFFSQMQSENGLRTIHQPWAWDD